jgi:hypothetical protein
MEELKERQKIQKLERASKALVIIFLILSLAYPFIGDNFRPGSFLCSLGGMAVYPYLYYPLLLLTILAAGVLFHFAAVRLNKKTGSAKLKSKFWMIFIASFILSASWLMLFAFVRGARDLAYFGKIGSDLHIIKSAQDLFYRKYGRYAPTQKELVENGMLPQAMENPYTDEEYTDADGLDIEGGDNNDQTWGAMAGVHEGAPSLQAICGIEKQDPNPGYYYLCNQQECRAVRDGRPLN